MVKEKDGHQWKDKKLHMPAKWKHEELKSALSYPLLYKSFIHHLNLKYLQKTCVLKAWFPSSWHHAKGLKLKGWNLAITKQLKVCFWRHIYPSPSLFLSPPFLHSLASPAMYFWCHKVRSQICTNWNLHTRHLRKFSPC